MNMVSIPFHSLQPVKLYNHSCEEISLNGKGLTNLESYEKLRMGVERKRKIERLNGKE